MRRKDYLLNPISRQKFADALAVNHNLKLEVCHMSDLLQKEIWKHTRFKTPLIKLEIRIITLDY